MRKIKTIDDITKDGKVEFRSEERRCRERVCKQV